ncbi:MAG: GNAT family N-acetyltransferase [Desulfobacterales bacterium]|nr:GNAT family N-acetyltransferase [Desulfobacterales bacterium]
MNQQSSTSKTFVLCREDHQVIGYYSLAAGAVAHEQASSRIKKGLSRNPVPVAILARLAVDRRWQGYKIGRWLLRDGLIRTVNISAQIGIRAILVHAKDDNARKFYTHHGFEASPVDPLMLMLLLKDIKKALAHEPPV